jgi:hypothetical protein
LASEVTFDRRNLIFISRKPKPPAMKNSKFLILILLWTMSCKDKSSSPALYTTDLVACGVKDPALNLPWLKKISDDKESR